MEDFTKIVRIGTTEYGNVFCKVKFKDQKLSITGVEGPLRSGNCKGGCGQINTSLKATDFKRFAPGWYDKEAIEKFLSIWEEWHLNDMQAGSPAQTKYLKENPVEYEYPYSHYEAASVALTQAGLNPDPSYEHNGKPYKYGSAWLRVEVPEDVLQWLRALPDTDITPAWV